MRLRNAAALECLRIWGPLAAIVVIGFLATYQYVGAPPPRAIRLAAGPTDGAYFGFAQQYAGLLAADGIDLDVRTTRGSSENLELLKRGEVTLALVQGGSAGVEDRRELEALASLFLEPLWVFVPDDSEIARLSELRGSRVAVGPPGSGTEKLATDILAASGITAANSTLVHRDWSDAAGLLLERDVNAAFLVASPSAPVVQDMVTRPGVALFPFERAAAYSRVFSFLIPVELSEGVLDLARNLPPRDTTVVAVPAMLVARRDLHPGLLPAVLDAATRVHSPGGVLEARRQFPSIDFTDLPMNRDAARYVTEGPSFLYRWLPYGTAVRLDRLKLLILPLVALLLPLFRVAPPLYQWRIRSRIYRWYAAVRDLDTAVREDREPTDATLGRLRTLERDVSSIRVPLAYAGELYHLRLHLRLLQEQLEERVREPKAAAAGTGADSEPG